MYSVHNKISNMQPQVTPFAKYELIAEKSLIYKEYKPTSKTNTISHMIDLWQAATSTNRQVYNLLHNEGGLSQRGSVTNTKRDEWLLQLRHGADNILGKLFPCTSC